VSTQRVLIVDDEPGIVLFLRKALEKEGLRVASAADGSEAMSKLARETFHLMITDLKMPGIDGMELVRRARAEQPEMEVIVLTAHGTVETAVQAMKLGAFDYLTKPIVSPDELRLLVARALERRRLREDRDRVQIAEAAGAELVAVDPAMVAVVTQIQKVAPTEATVLLLGESGTGKELLAHAIHRQSKRSDGPFVAVNCGALAETLLESELFGHEKGAFTGAVAVRRGRFEMADAGTLFLDEVTELKPTLQVKLLRVLQERTFERVGGSRSIETDIRLIAASNRDLKRAIAEGQFRDDLYHRLAVFPVAVPPLRDRPGDIVPIAEHMVQKLAVRLGRAGLGLDDGARQKLLGYDWPGNVRELLNVLERAAIIAEDRVLSAADLFGLDGALVAGPETGPALEGTLEQIEKQAIRRALAATGGHRRRAAARLGIGLRTLYDKLKQYGIG
jgi:two-component system response regulator FlrC